MRFAVYGIITLLTSAWAAAVLAAPCGPRTSESNDEVVYATDCAIQYAATTTTGGIQEAIDSCGAGSPSKGCIVVLPRGDVHVTSTISIGGLDLPTAKMGVVLRGHGSGVVNTIQVPRGGTNIIWDDEASGASVISVQGIGHRLEDFNVWGDSGDNGVNVVDTLLEIQALGSAMTSGIIVESVGLFGTRDLGGLGATQPLGVAVRGKGGNYNDQLDRIVVRNSSVSRVRGCLEQNSKQALLNLWQQVNCSQFDEFGVNILAGSFSIVESVFSWNRDTHVGAAIQFNAGSAGGTLYENVERCHFEMGSGMAIRATSEGGAQGRRAMRIVGNNFVMQYADPSPDDPEFDNDFINLQERGSVAITGNSFEWTTGTPPISGVGGDIVVNSTLPSQVFAAANFTRNLVNLDWEVTGAAHLVCHDADELGVFDDANCDSQREPGEAYLNGASNSDSQGAMRWGMSDGADWDTGDEVCAEVGLSCTETFDLDNYYWSHRFVACDEGHDTGHRFLALCK